MESRQRDPLRVVKGVQKNLAAFADAVSLLPRQIKATYRKVMHGDIRINVHHEELRHLITDIDKSSNRLASSPTAKPSCQSFVILRHTHLQGG